MATKIDLNGSWHNGYGSDMNLEVDDSGVVRGKFRTAVGRAETKTLWQNRWFDVIGFVNGDLLSFVVNFDSPGAMLVANGRLVRSETEGAPVHCIETISLNRFNLPDEDSWKSVTTNACNYERGPSPA